MTRHTFYVSGMPIRGMVSSRDHAALSDGEFKTFQNVRARSGCIKVRGPVVDKSSTVAVGGALAGSAKVVVNGTTYQLVAVDDGSSIRCYYGTDATFTEFTGPASNNKYGLTRLGTGKWVVFEVVRETTASTVAPFTAANTGKDLVYASDGTTSIVWDPAGSSTDKSWVAPHAAVWHPGPGKVRQEATYPYFTSLAASNLAAGATSGTGTIADNTAHAVTGGLCPTWTFTASADDGILTVTTGTTLAKNKQVWMVFDCPIDPLVLDHVKIQLYDSAGTTFRTLWDPSSATSEKPTIVPCARGFKLALFKVDRSVLPDVTYTDIKVVWIDAVAPATAATAFNLMAIGASGNTPGGSSHALTTFNSGSHAESVGIVCDDKGGVSLKNLGCQDAKNFIDIPVTPLSYYSYTVYGQQPSDADKNLGLDYALVYRRSFGGGAYYHVKSYVLATYDTGSHAWSHDGGRSALQDISISVDTDTLTMRTAPDAYNTAAPSCAALAVAGGRLLCGSARPASVGYSANPADVYISEQDHPFRHREILRIENGVPDLTSGTCVKFPGEKVMRIVPIVGDLQASETALVFTDQNVWALSGPGSLELSRPRRLSTKGTRSPWSVAVYNNAVVYLDEDRRLVMIRPGEPPVSLSTGRMDNILEAIPTARLDNVYAGVFRDRYYMSYTIGGGSANTAVLVYDFVFDTFSRDVCLSALTFGTFHALDVGTSGQLRFWDETVHDTYGLYEHDASSGTTDAAVGGGGAQAVVPYIETRMVHDGSLWGDLSLGNLGVVCQPDTGNSLSAYWTGRPSGRVGSGNVSLTPQGGASASAIDATQDTVTFSPDPSWRTGDAYASTTTANGFTSGSTVYARRESSGVYTFYDTRAHALAGGATGKTNVTGTLTSLAFVPVVAAIRHWKAEPVDGWPDGGAYAVFTGSVSANKEVYSLVGETVGSDEGARTASV